MPPFNTLITDSAQHIAIFSFVACVELPKWGESTTLSSFFNSSFISGSYSYTSSPAAYIIFSERAAAKSLSLIIAPLPIFTKTAVFFIFLNSLNEKICLVSSVNGAVIIRKSDHSKSSSNVA